MRMKHHRLMASLVVFIIVLFVGAYASVYIAMSCEDFSSSMPAPAQCALYDPTPSSLGSLLEIGAFFGIPIAAGFITWMLTKPRHPSEKQ